MSRASANASALRGVPNARVLEMICNVLASGNVLPCDPSRSVEGCCTYRNTYLEVACRQTGGGAERAVVCAQRGSRPVCTDGTLSATLSARGAVCPAGPVPRWR